MTPGHGENHHVHPSHRRGAGRCPAGIVARRAGSGRRRQQRLRAGPSDIPAAVPRLLQDAQDMVLRDRNHASIVIWSLCNELGCTADQPGGGDIAVQFKQQVFLF